MKRLLLCSLLLLSLAVFSAEIKGKVVAVSDGDTITVLDEMDKGNFKIRLDKIDAPEKKQPFGSKAKQFLSSLIFGKQVTVRFKAVDRYGRIIGTVYCDEVEINLVWFKTAMRGITAITIKPRHISMQKNWQGQIKKDYGQTTLP